MYVQKLASIAQLVKVDDCIFFWFPGDGVEREDVILLPHKWKGVASYQGPWPP
jgi:hypothetical protein